MDYKRMASEYLEEVARIDRRLEQLRRENRAHREADLWVRMGALMEIRDDLQATAHVLQRAGAAGPLGALPFHGLHPPAVGRTPSLGPPAPGAGLG